ncbi:MAG: MarR family transcriptional regulator [Phycisphaerales bacterium]|nr:MarR family transcriptional regulator [Phycisphaerales bacterium]
MADAPTPREGTSTEVRDARLRFIEAWTEMGSRWGVPRSMTAVHALLFIEGTAMDADEIMARLGISRGNVSMTLRTLVEWGIVRRAAQGSQRRDTYEAEQDVWTLFSTVVRARKEREIDPLAKVLQGCLTSGDAASRDPSAEAHDQRIRQMMDFVDTFDGLLLHFVGPGGKGLHRVASLLRRATRGAAPRPSR